MDEETNEKTPEELADERMEREANEPNIIDVAKDAAREFLESNNGTAYERVQAQLALAQIEFLSYLLFDLGESNEMVAHVLSHVCGSDEEYDTSNITLNKGLAIH